MALKIQFDPNQSYQTQAVEAVARLFDGLPRAETSFSLSGESIPNLSPSDSFDEGWLYENLCTVQTDRVIQNGKTIVGASMLEADQGLILEGAGYEAWRTPHFTVEMETGTGKTYVYLRTIYELRKRYGFGKFIIIVPSIAIYEGVAKNFSITRDHFRALYGNETVNLIRYDGAQLSRLRSFATSTFCEIMVMTLDSFNRASNVIYKPTEKLQGELKPYQYIQETRPILILDEPQNMESQKSKEALRTLHPLFALRYSATHRSSPNLVYRLTPFDAFQQNLVKKIQVLGVTEHENYNLPFLALLSVSGEGSAIRATVRTHVRQGANTLEQDVILKHSDNLYAKTHREEHRSYVVAEINVKEGFVAFENGDRLVLGQGVGALRREVFRVQIGKTIEKHLALQERLRERGIKVLSLFFIDRVQNYTAPDGIIKTLFDECFDLAKSAYPSWQDKAASDVRSAYFAKSKQGGTEVDVETRDIDEQEKTLDEKKAEKAAFDLIMKDKEKLLGFAESAAFIFAHSALREGWDNPNVFQICTLNQTISETRKRQEIGRGLRLCVNQEGARVFGDDVNILTVVANESYQAYIANLQREYRDEEGEAPPKPTDAGKAPAHRNEAIFGHREFRRLWGSLATKVIPSFNLDTDALITECKNRFNQCVFTLPVIVVEQGDFVRTKFRLHLLGLGVNGNARVKIEKESTDGEDTMEATYPFKKNNELDKILHDDRLRGFRIKSIDIVAGEPQVTFGNDIILTMHSPYEWTSEIGQKISQRAMITPREIYPVANLIDRAARETGLTRPTINRIFKAIPPDKATFLLRNPESFISTFISEVSNALADHIAGRIEFKPTGDPGNDFDLDALFPAVKQFTQRELRDAGMRGLYDQVQIDSDNEQSFVQIIRDDPELVFYFKFPPSFKIALPKQIGNYNPDWGLGRLGTDGLTLLYVRETKGNEDINRLQFSSEKRKIRCAQKYFSALGVDYRPVAGTNAYWWQP